MKRIHILRTTAALVLSLFLLLTAPAALAAELTRGITWDTTVQGMLTIEGIPEGQTRDGFEEGEYLNHAFLHFADTPYITMMTYTFKSGQLVRYVEIISDAMQEGDVFIPQVFLEQLDVLMARHGGPTMTDQQRAIDAYNAMAEGSLTEDIIELFSGWQLDKGTALYLLCLNVEGSMSIYTAYFNEGVLLDGENAD